MADPRNGTMSHPVTETAIRKNDGSLTAYRQDLPTGVMRPRAEGLYDPTREVDACGVGFIVNMKNIPSQK
ncbi:MAG: hypothetical protein EOP21_13765, partial [Hyphomicrobiales bacterium]